MAGWRAGDWPVWAVWDSVDGYHAVPGRMRLALWQLLVFLERELSGNKETAAAEDQRCLGPRGPWGQIGLAPPRRPPSVQAARLATLGVTLFEPAEPGLPCLGLVRRTSQ